jgi:hypothetical protein
MELIEEEHKWDPEAVQQRDGRLVNIHVAASELDIRQRVKRAGGRWNPQRGVWELPYAQVVALQLEKRIMPVQKRI